MKSRAVIKIGPDYHLLNTMMSEVAIAYLQIEPELKQIFFDQYIEKHSQQIHNCDWSFELVFIKQNQFNLTGSFKRGNLCEGDAIFVKKPKHS